MLAEPRSPHTSRFGAPRASRFDRKRGCSQSFAAFRRHGATSLSARPSPSSGRGSRDRCPSARVGSGTSFDSPATSAPKTSATKSRPRCSARRSGPVPCRTSCHRIRFDSWSWRRLASGYRTLRRETYSTLFALLASTGLRVSEAIHLRLDDITPDGLVIRCSKFRKSRLVPLHETARAGLERYLQRRWPYAPDRASRVRVAAAQAALARTSRVAFRIARARSVCRTAGRARPTPTPCGTPLPCGPCSSVPGRPRRHHPAHAGAVHIPRACQGRRHLLVPGSDAGAMTDIADRCERFVMGGAAMTPLAPHLTAFFQQRLPVERRASATPRIPTRTPSSCCSPSQRAAARAASALPLEQIDAPLVVSFLEAPRDAPRQSPELRNVRLAAIKSFMHFVEYPRALRASSRSSASSPSRPRRRHALVRHLTVEEMQAISTRPTRPRRDGAARPSDAPPCFAGGLRVSELVGLAAAGLHASAAASILVHGKGRRERVPAPVEGHGHRPASVARGAGTVATPEALRQCPWPAA